MHAMCCLVVDCLVSIRFRKIVNFVERRSEQINNFNNDNNDIYHGYSLPSLLLAFRCEKMKCYADAIKCRATDPSI
jgi:hypothetical protein